METTRHFTATVYVVNDGATALHEHRRHGIRIPPGGHVDRGELPHEAGLREVREETGLHATLLDDTPEIPSPDGETLPNPRHTLLYDINEHGGAVGHQHVDLIYYAEAEHRDIDPTEDEAEADAWAWYTPEDLRSSDIAEDVVRLGIDAIETAEG
jgi:8-oxo-dGTP pyrophosphatase MutT (NUDIX family)